MMHGVDYEAFQPFCGGLSFVVLQGAAWSLYSFSLVVNLSCLYFGLDQVQTTLDGVVASNGFVLGVAQLILTASLPHFEPQHSRGKSEGGPVPAMASWPKGTKRFTVTLSLVTLALLGLADWVLLAESDLASLFFFVPDPSWARLFPLQLCGSITLLVSLPVTIYLQDRGSNSKPTTPERKRREAEGNGPRGWLRRLFGEYATVQLMGITLWLFTLCLAVLFGVERLWCRESPGGAPEGCFAEGGVLQQATEGAVAIIPQASLRNTATGAGGLAAQLLVLFGGGTSSLGGSLGAVFGFPAGLHGRISRSFPDFASRLTVVTATLTGHLGSLLEKALGFVAESWSLVIAEIAFLLSCHLFLRWLRFYLDGAMRTWAVWWGYHSRARAQDGEVPMAGIAVEALRYGTHPKERVHVMRRTDRGGGCGEGGGEPAPSLRERGAVLYAHGGGFVAVQSAHLRHSMSPLVRLGFDVFSIDYPLAPEDPFPAPVVATLRALKWMKEERGVTRVVLIGDSAGGGLVTYAAAALQHSPLLAELAATSGEAGLGGWSFPEVERLISVYGFVDQSAWKASWMAYPLGFCLRCLEPSVPVMDRRYTVGELDAASLTRYPPSLLLCAASDSLTESNEALASKLRSVGRECKVEVYPGFHSFHGIPVQWSLGAWRQNTLPATDHMVQFLTDGEVTMNRVPEEDGMPFDWSFFAVIGVTLLLPALLGTYFACVSTFFVFGTNGLLGLWATRGMAFLVIGFGAHYVLCMATDRLLSIGFERDGVELSSGKHLRLSGNS